MKIFEMPSTLPLRFVAAPKTNPGMGGNEGLIESWATLKLDRFALAGRSCYRRSNDSPKKVRFSTAFSTFPSYFP